MIMKRILIIVLALILTCCDKPGDCVKSTGPITSKTFDGLTFSKVLVYKGISVVIKEGPEYLVEVKAGENLVNDIEVTVANGMLRVADNTTCNWTREYGATVVYITAPNLTEIYSKTEKTIISDGVLHFPDLRLLAMDSFDGFNGVGTGDFVLEIDNNRLTVDNNNVARYFISGHTDECNINFYESGGIFHGEDLLANHVQIYHRGTNDIAVKPIESVSGNIYNIGNIICVSRPETVDVSQHYTGRLIIY